MTEPEVISALKAMERDPTLITQPSFTTNSVEYPNNRIPFVEYHVHYLRTHKLTRPLGYLSNLRLILKKRA